MSNEGSASSDKVAAANWDTIELGSDGKGGPLPHLSNAELARLRDCEGNALKHLYNAPLFQVAMVGLVFFMCPGMLNALQGIGGGGQMDTHTSSSSSIAIYSTFAVGSILAGTIVNKIGTKPALITGTLGYALYFASFLSYNINGNQGFVIAAGAIMGFCAGLLWAAEGAIMLSVATERQKGRYISVFWILLSLGSVVGAAVELGLSYNDNSRDHVNNGTYIAFLVLGASGGVIAALMQHPGKLVKADGTRVVIPPSPEWKEELLNLGRVLLHDRAVLFLIIPFLASNWYYTWQFSVYNVEFFNLRTRALNNLVYWIAQIVGSYLIGILLDFAQLHRRTRAVLGLSIVTCLVWGTFPGNYVAQRNYEPGVTRPMDLTEFRFVRYCLLYIFNGFMDSMWQCYTFYLIGAMSNDMAKLAHIAGVYKGIQSAGAAGAFGLNLNKDKPVTAGMSQVYIDQVKQSRMAQLAVPWALCAAGLLCFIPVVVFRIRASEAAAPDAGLKHNDQIESGDSEKPHSL